MSKDKHTAKRSLAQSAKKKIAKKVVKKSVKHNVNKKTKQNKQSPAQSAVTQMSKLEYEQAMMDPRFRAAMQGFNNPANNINQVANQQLRE